MLVSDWSLTHVRPFQLTSDSSVTRSTREWRPSPTCGSGIVGDSVLHSGFTLHPHQQINDLLMFRPTHFCCISLLWDNGWLGTSAGVMKLWHQSTSWHCSRTMWSLVRFSRTSKQIMTLSSTHWGHSSHVGNWRHRWGRGEVGRGWR